MIGPLATGLILLSLAIGLFALLSTARNKTVGNMLLIALGVLELGLLVQAGFVIAALVRGEGPQDTATLIGYLGGTLAIPPVAAFWGAGERSRWGPAVIAVAGFAIPGMVGRMLQIWQGLV
ncbi:hypothetical protein FHS43_004401 [Streptosporangium becharense]|uniref:Integral membrane protein n=1 Tax=Streptosporangium becharense TaxID=1816182 RepID=A0A7W9MIW7_9ACTN|nr:hypothetical protein [Streptosporangium becharense]MBB2913103.1 hypothetical protein [Streptosporangium becharense]MBB5822086.1 hypothetical protein [Streptosporangium becharense]